MGQIVVSGSMMSCSFGLIPCVFQAMSAQSIVSKAPVGTIQDTSIASISGFKMCSSLSNPTVSAATTAALGILTPMPCIPVIAGTWILNTNVLIKGKPVLTTNAKCMCAYGGSISFMNTIQMNVNIK